MEVLNDLVRNLIYIRLTELVESVEVYRTFFVKFLEIKPPGESLTKGTRVAAKWSAKFRELYPGTVAVGPTDDNDVYIEFDDGDSGPRQLDDVRLLPPDYPLVERDPDPIMGVSRKRRRTDSGQACVAYPGVVSSGGNGGDSKGGVDVQGEIRIMKFEKSDAKL